MQDWNDLRLVLAVVRAGNLTGAAKALGVNHSTAFRRLAALEEEMGVRLFERLPAGAYAPTEAGERMAASAERIETEAAALDREILGHDQQLTGRLRVTASETLGFRILTPLIGRFRCQHPGIQVELAVDNRILSLSRREADVALRALRPREGDLHGRRLGTIGWTLFAKRELVAGLPRLGPEPESLEGLPLIGWEQGMSGINAADWLNARAPEAAFVYRSSSLLNQFVAVKAGMGVAVLPCYLGDPEPDLVRLTEAPVAALGRELWIVTHTDLRRTARVRAFFDLIGEGFAEARSLLEGTSS
ncbi:LysR family transcriptional regulator [Ferrovibrio sp.]|uniref:LysR family transcriptional regulator n=1 Tax=Ferrovibrio sp. TaxID=1917215 RepID=UPI003D2AE6BD